MNQKDASGAESLYLVKIKKERIDPEIEYKINAISVKVESERVENVTKTRTIDASDEEPCEADDANSNSNATQTTTAGDGEQDKKFIEPVKSSNEILAELFKVFNAQPPEELLDDKNLLKKSHKHKKHKKEKKKKVKKEIYDGERSDSDSSNSQVGSSRSSSKHKHKKKKKHKHKEQSEKEKEKSKDKGDKGKKKSKEKGKQKGKEKSKDVAKGKSKEIAKENSKEHDIKKTPLPTRIKKEPDERKCDRKRHTNGTVPAKSSRNESGRDRSRERERERDRDKEKERYKEKERERGHNSFYNGFRDGERSREKERHREVIINAEPSDLPSRHRDRHDKDGHISEISLSDEETYLRERERVSDSSRRRGAGHQEQQQQHERSHTARAHNNFYSGAPRSRSRDHVNRYRRGAGSGRGRSRSRSRSRDLGIDKKRLLEIARKNAISMFKRGNLPGCAEMTEEVKDKVLLKMRYGGRTVQDLTDFCKKISNGENLSDLSSDEDSDADKSGNAKAFHHPFLLKEREPIVMHIRNSTAIVPRKTDDQTKAITMQFPVSSGQQHRMTEGWVPVESKDKLAPLPSLPAATQSTNIFKGTTAATKNIFAKPMPQQEEQEPAFKAVAAATAATITPDSITDIALPSLPQSLPPAPVPALTDSCVSSTPAIAVPKPVPPVATALVIAPAPVPSPPSLTFVPDVPVPSVAAPSESIFPQACTQNFDVSSIISKRLNAMRRLQENPMDSEAIKMMYNSQKEMTSWASSKHLPGQFTGSTGVNVLKARELNSGPQVWARRDQLTSTQPLAGGMGMHLLQKMGWKPGEGLGREKTGSLQPLLLDVKLDKRGLVAKDDNGYQHHQQQPKKQRLNTVVQAQQAITDKHPVCLLNELTSKRKWTPPLYQLVNEEGPSHNKMFVFSVSINGQLFTPKQASSTKKEAKLLAARNCLQQMGILPM